MTHTKEATCMFCWWEDREGTDKKASRGGMWPCPQALGFGELSIIALI